MEFYKVLHQCPSCRKKNWPEVVKERLVFTCPSCSKDQMVQLEFPATAPVMDTGKGWRWWVGVFIGGSLGTSVMAAVTRNAAVFLFGSLIIGAAAALSVEWMLNRLAPKAPRVISGVENIKIGPV